MADVFTIFNHGTGSHRAKNKAEVVTKLGAAAAGIELGDYLICDGPGSSNKILDPETGEQVVDPESGEGLKDEENLMPSNFDPTNIAKGKKKNSRYLGYDKVSTPGYIRGRARLRGTGE